MLIDPRVHASIIIDMLSVAYTRLVSAVVLSVLLLNSKRAYCLGHHYLLSFLIHLHLPTMQHRPRYR